MKQSLGLHVSQSLNLTPQLQQALRLLMLSGLELEQEVEHILQDNPMLERDGEGSDSDGELGTDMDNTPADATSTNSDSDSNADAQASETADQPSDWDGEDGYSHENLSEEWSELPVSTAVSGSSKGSGDPDFDPASAQAAHEDLHSTLHSQALALGIDHATLQVVQFLIGNLNDEGYLDGSLIELAQSLLTAGTTESAPAEPDFEQLEIVLEQLTGALKHLQQLDPAGVGARDTAECLTLQLERLFKTTELDSAVYDAAVMLCKTCMDGMARADFAKMRKACGADDTITTAAFHLVQTLDPKPGRIFAVVDVNYITPDVFVREETPEEDASNAARRTATFGTPKTQFTVEINTDTVPKLHINQLYAQTLKSNRMLSTTPLGGKLQEAKWFLRSLQQRYDTLLRVSQVIVERQQDFFKRGAIGMKPLILKEVADLLGMHESTISRVTTGKYLSCTQGTFELKYFFSSSVGTAGGGSASSIAVTAMIQELIANENKAKPMSDQAISNALKKRGVSCARRTVAKYRESLRIATASLRKELPKT